MPGVAQARPASVTPGAAHAAFAPPQHQQHQQHQPTHPSHTPPSAHRPQQQQQQAFTRQHQGGPPPVPSHPPQFLSTPNAVNAFAPPLPQQQQTLFQQAADTQLQMLAQQVAALTRDKRALQGDVEKERGEKEALRRQLEEALENVSVLEEGQGFLLQRHKQAVSECHAKVKKSKDDAKTAEDALHEMQEVVDRQAKQHATFVQNTQRQMEDSMKAIAAAQPTIPLDQAHKAELQQLLAVIEDLQKAMDEKNDLIDMLSQQIAQQQQTAVAAQALQSETVRVCCGSSNHSQLPILHLPLSRHARRTSKALSTKRSAVPKCCTRLSAPILPRRRLTR